VSFINTHHETIHAAKEGKLQRGQCPDLTLDELDALGIPDTTGTRHRHAVTRAWKERRKAREDRRP
jgi:hypothetical protein